MENIERYFYLLLAGCQWESLPGCYGAPGTVHDRFQEWQKAGLFEKMWQAGLLDCDNEKGLEWEGQAIDGANRHDKMLVILKMAKSSVKPGLSYFMGVI